MPPQADHHDGALPPHQAPDFLVDDTSSETSTQRGIKSRKRDFSGIASWGKSVAGVTRLELAASGLTGLLTYGNERKTRRFAARIAKGDAQTHVRSHVNRKPDSPPTSPLHEHAPDPGMRAYHGGFSAEIVLPRE